jgi:VRR-NUC domain
MAVMRYLRVACPDVLSIHCPNGGYRRKTEAAILKGMGAMAGTPDILLLWKPAKVAFIELKTPKSENRLSADQIAFLTRLSELGIPNAVCVSLDAVRLKIKEWGIPCRETRAR